MKLGLAMHPEKWSDRHLAMARQLGCETVIAWVPFGAGDGVWHAEDFERIFLQAKKHGLVLEGIENFHPQHIDHVATTSPFSLKNQVVGNASSGNRFSAFSGARSIR